MGRLSGRLVLSVYLRHDSLGGYLRVRYTDKHRFPNGPYRRAIETDVALTFAKARERMKLKPEEHQVVEIKRERKSGTR